MYLCVFMNGIEPNVSFKIQIYEKICSEIISE